MIDHGNMGGLASCDSIFFFRFVPEIDSFPATGIVNFSHSGPRDFNKPPAQTDIIPLLTGTR